jgi:hypothetical protein
MLMSEIIAYICLIRHESMIITRFLTANSYFSLEENGSKIGLTMR